MKLIIDEIGRIEEPDDNQDYDDYEPTPWTPDEGPEVKARMDERRERFERGEWWLIGIRAAAKLHWAKDDGRTSISGPTITSPGIWGCESDGDEEYLDEIYREELETLKDMLLAMGLSKDDIKAKL